MEKKARRNSNSTLTATKWNTIQVFQPINVHLADSLKLRQKSIVLVQMQYRITWLEH